MARDNLITSSGLPPPPPPPPNKNDNFDLSKNRRVLKRFKNCERIPNVEHIEVPLVQSIFLNAKASLMWSDWGSDLPNPVSGQRPHFVSQISAQCIIEIIYVDMLPVTLVKSWIYILKENNEIKALILQREWIERYWSPETVETASPPKQPDFELEPGEIHLPLFFRFPKRTTHSHFNHLSLRI